MSTLDKKSSDNPMLGEMGEKGNNQVYSQSYRAKNKAWYKGGISNNY